MRETIQTALEQLGEPQAVGEGYLYTILGTELCALIYTGG